MLTGDERHAWRHVALAVRKLVGAGRSQAGKVACEHAQRLSQRGAGGTRHEAHAVQAGSW